MTAWHTVEIDLEKNQTNPVEEKTLAYKKEIEEWIADLYQNSDMLFIWKHMIDGVFQFSTEESAIAFKMRWI